MLWSVAVLGIVLFLFSSFVYSRQAQDLRTATLNRLAVKTDQLVALFRFGSSIEGLLPFSDNIPSGTAILQEDEVLALVGSQGQVIQVLGPIKENDVANLVETDKSLGLESGLRQVQLEGKFATGFGFKNYLLLLTPVLFRQEVVGLFVATAGGYWLAGRAMRPVQIITRAAREISETDLSRRLNLKTQDELGELADTFDQMLARLQAAFDRQRQFTADASHELRTPLTIVGLESSRALEAHRSPQEYGRALQVIQSENEFMTRLVNDLLTLARMDAGQTVLKLEEVDLSDIALEAVERLAPLAVRKNVELSTGELPELPVKGDRQYLLQMVTNLVENAIKYSQGDGQHVHVETGRRETQAWLRVEDNGPGIAPEHLLHIFERFYRVDKARSRDLEGGETSDGSRESSGSGLGLSIVQWIAQAHGGKVSLQSEVGKGSVFEVSLPLLV
jgi:signal transduction histidine kinase